MKQFLSLNKLIAAKHDNQTALFNLFAGHEVKITEKAIFVDAGHQQVQAYDYKSIIAIFEASQKELGEAGSKFLCGALLVAYAANNDAVVRQEVARAIVHGAVEDFCASTHIQLAISRIASYNEHTVDDFCDHIWAKGQDQKQSEYIKPSQQEAADINSKALLFNYFNVVIAKLDECDRKELLCNLSKSDPDGWFFNIARQALKEMAQTKNSKQFQPG